MINLNEISLEMLSSKEKLDYSTLIRCKRNGLMNLEDIFQYYLNNGDFRRLKLISERTNRKLITICEKYNNCNLNLYFKNENQNFSLADLSKIDHLSSRSVTICLNYKLNSLRDILHFYFIEKRSFRDLRNCGKNTEEELVLICEKYNDLTINTVNPLLQEIALLTVKQKQIINNLILFKFNELSNLAQSALSALLNKDITLSSFVNNIFSDPKFNIDNIRNSDIKSEIETNKFLDSIIEEIGFVSGYYDGGTIGIGDIVEDYLQSQTEPKHIDEITKYVNNFRNSASINIFAILSLNAKKRFVFFCDSHVGLSQKEYFTEEDLKHNELQVEKNLDSGLIGG